MQLKKLTQPPADIFKLLWVPPDTPQKSAFILQKGHFGQHFTKGARCSITRVLSNRAYFACGGFLKMLEHTSVLVEYFEPMCSLSILQVGK